MRNSSPFSLQKVFNTRNLFLFLAGLAIFVAGIWLIAIPEKKISELIEDSLNADSVKLEVKGLKKGFFFNIFIEQLTLNEKDERLASIGNLSARLDPLNLFFLKISVSFRGMIQRGILEGNAVAGVRGKKIIIRLDNAEMTDIPYLKKLGFDGTGLLNIEFAQDHEKSRLKFNITNAQLKTASFSGVGIPMELFSRAKGLVSMDANTVSISSLGLEGDGIFGRVKGTIKNRQADLILEIMPEASAQNRFPVLVMLDSYKVSPGYYKVPIKTTF